MQALAVISWWAFALRIHRLESPLATVILVASMLIIATAMWCAFFPPAALRRRVEAVARRSDGASA